MSSLLDLVQLADVKAELGLASTSSDARLERLITAASTMFHQATGYLNQDSSLPATSPFSEPVAFTDVYDGSGKLTQSLRLRPCVSVQTVMVNGQLVTPSAGYGQAGYKIAGTADRLFMMSPASNGYFVTPGIWPNGGCFSRGMQNVSIAYTAGYSGVPFDIAEQLILAIIFNYQRPANIGTRSKSLPSFGGTVSYADSSDPLQRDNMFSATDSLRATVARYKRITPV